MQYHEDLCKSLKIINGDLNYDVYLLFSVMCICMLKKCLMNYSCELIREKDHVMLAYVQVVSCKCLIKCFHEWVVNKCIRLCFLRLCYDLPFMLSSSGSIQYPKIICLPRAPISYRTQEYLTSIPSVHETQWTQFSSIK